MLKTVDVEAWTPYMSSIVEEAAGLNIRVGAVIGFVDQQQNAYKMVGVLEGMTDAEATCLSQAVEQCKDNLRDWETIFGSPEMVNECRSAFARNCFQYQSEYFETCSTLLEAAGLSVPTVP